MSFQMDLEVPRNGNYYETWSLADIDGEPIDLTGHTLEMDCRAIAGAGSVLASADIDVYDAANGYFTVNWTGSDFDGVGSLTEIVRLAYDLKHTFPDAIIDIAVRGHIVLIPEVTA